MTDKTKMELANQNVALFGALARLTRWATHGIKSGNPYLHPEVTAALEMLGEIEGIEDPYDVDTAKIIREATS